MYVVRTPERDRIAAALEADGIASAAYYTTPLHRQPVFARSATPRDRFPRRSGPRGRTSRCRSGPGSRRTTSGGWSSACCPLRPSGHGREADQPLPHLARVRRRRPHRARLVPRVLAPLRQRHPGPVPAALRALDLRSSCRSRWPPSSCSASTATGGATSRSGTCGPSFAASRLATIVAQLAVYLIEPVTAGSRTQVGRRPQLAHPPRARGGSTSARAHAHRAAWPTTARPAWREALIIGGGDAGQLIVTRDAEDPGLGYSPIGLVDDDPRKRNLRIHGCVCSARPRSCRC